MVVQLAKPCRARYRRRRATTNPPKKFNASVGDESTTTRALQIQVDLDLCQGHAICATESPEVVEIDRAKNKVVIQHENVNAGLRASVESAVRHCPTRALSIVVPKTDLDDQESK